MLFRKTKIAEFIIDKTQLKAGSEYIWLWTAIEHVTKNIVAKSILKERNMFVAERFLSNHLKEHYKHSVSKEIVGQGINHKPVSFWN